MFDTLIKYNLDQYKSSITSIKQEDDEEIIIDHLQSIIEHYRERLNKEICKYSLLETFNLEDTIKIFDDCFYTQEDYEEKIGFCEYCEEDYERDELSFLDDQSCCDSCYDRYSITCSDCGNSFHQDSDDCQYYECVDRNYCDICYPNHVGYCDNCHEYYNPDYPCCDEEDYEEDDEESYIKNYSYKPKQLFLKKPNETTNLFYGIEIETILRNSDSLNDIALKTLNQFEKNEVILKYDGSIGSDGFEIVSNTATFEYHKSELWNCFFNSDLTDDLKSFHVASCGLHIHASRDFYSKLDIGKIVLFLNLPYNKDFLTSLSGRDYNSYCRHNPNKKVTDYKSQERFEQLNLTNNKTIEFRLFKGNIKRQSVFRYLEFVDSLSHFVKEITLQTNNLKFWHFVKWVKDNPNTKKKYNNLNSWLEKKGFYKILENKVIFIKNDNVRLSK